MKSRYSHRGWFGFCPIYINDPYGHSPNITPRRSWLMPLLRLAIGVQQAAIATCTLVNPEWEPTWKIRLTGKL